jgi:hypothetical protein
VFQKLPPNIGMEDEAAAVKKEKRRRGEMGGFIYPLGSHWSVRDPVIASLLNFGSSLVAGAL